MVYLFGDIPVARTCFGRTGAATRAILLVATLLSALGLLAVVDADTREFRGRVVGVTDGDTLAVLHGQRPEVIRLHGIDAPEQGQPFGARAKQAASALAFRQTVTVRVRDRNRYGRTVADVILPDGRQLNRELVRARYAWWFRRYSSDARLAQAEARTAHVGLWSDRDAVPPWEWRRATR
jgi:endonuclease YncB( thermonuclease family)